MLGDPRPSAVIDDIVAVIVFVVVNIVHPPCAADAIVDVDAIACLVRAAPGTLGQPLDDIKVEALEDL